MTYGTYPSVNQAVSTFIHEELIEAVLVADPPLMLNISSRFVDFLVAADFNKLVAEEEAEKRIGFVRQRLGQALDNWVGIGLPAPVGYTDNPDTVLTWKHSHYFRITGGKPLSPQFVRIYDWLTGLGPREFLLPCAVFLKIIGCDPIFVTDGPHDEGVDCIGKVADGPTRSILVFAQCKTITDTNRLVRKNTVTAEYAKYVNLPNTPKHKRYLHALRLKKCRDGSSSVYVFLANGEFDKHAEAPARDLGILLRSARQLSHFLSLKRDARSITATSVDTHHTFSA